MLHVGDVVFKKDDEILLIIERKTVADLLQSVKDGRYRDQKARLLSVTEPKHVVYIIEGYGEIDPITRGCIVNMQLRDGISVLVTENIEQTAEMVTYLREKLLKDPSQYVSSTTQNPVYNLKQKRNENIDPRTCFKSQLCQIPHVSQTTATLIATKFSCMSALIKFINECENPVKEMSDWKPSKKRIGSKLATSIYENLCKVT